MQEIYCWKTKFYQQSFSLKNFVFLIFLTSSHNIKRAFEKPKAPLSGFLKSSKWPKTAELFFPKNKCQSKLSDRSLIRNFSRRWNNLPIEIRKEKTKNKFNVKLHERFPIDKQVRGFRNFFYLSIKTKLFIYLRGKLFIYLLFKYLTKRFCCGYNFKFTILKKKNLQDAKKIGGKTETKYRE